MIARKLTNVFKVKEQEANFFPGQSQALTEDKIVNNFQLTSNILRSTSTYVLRTPTDLLTAERKTKNKINTTNGMYKYSMNVKTPILLKCTEEYTI